MTPEVGVMRWVRRMPIPGWPPLLDDFADPAPSDAEILLIP